MITLSTLVHQLRSEVLMDLDQSDFRFPDKIVVRAVNHTILDMLQKKPILRFTDTNAYAEDESFLVDENALSDTSTEINLPARYREALLHGTAARLFNGDANNQVDAQRMALEKARFDELMLY